MSRIITSLVSLDSLSMPIAHSARRAAVLALLAAPALAQDRPAIKPLGAVTARSTPTFTSVTAVRQLPGGRLLVNDVGSRRLVLLDSALATAQVIADTTPATASAYSGRIGGLITYRGDSVLFVDPASLSMLVIDGTGKVARVMSVPRSDDAMFLANPGFGTPGFDASGRLVYRASNRPQMRQGPPAPGQPFTPPVIPDSAAIVRIDLATRRLDTLGFVRTPKVTMHVEQSEGRVMMRSLLNPLPLVDDWAVLPDGQVAFVRGRDYHVDWVRADGTRVSTAKVPFDWQRLTDEDKVAFIDSVKAARQRMQAQAPAGGAPAAPAQGGASGQSMQMVFIGPGGSPGGPPTTVSPQMTQAQVEFVPPTELPDYKPPFFSGGVRADADGNLWVLTIPTHAIQGGPVYDVMNAAGEVFERVQVPAGRNIIGFGRGGVVYLLARDGGTLTVERASAP